MVDYRLYTVTGREYLATKELPHAIEAAIASGFTIIQLREKQTDSRQFYELATTARTITEQHGAALIINDRPDIMLSVGADGVHIGPEDLPVPIVRKLIGPNAIIGFSAGTVAEAIQAEKQGADYLGTGAVFSSVSKHDAGRPIGIEGLRKVVAGVTIPVVAIGGINADNAGECIAAGASGIAVCSALFKGDVRENGDRFSLLKQ